MGFDTKGLHKVKCRAVIDRISILAQAKLNLHLRVGAKRPDGFHDLESLFQAVDLGDRIVARSLKNNEIRIEGDFDCAFVDTSLYRAAALFFQRAGIQGGVHIQVEKKIPAQAGLGAASTDAAAALVALNILYKTGMSSAELADLGMKISSDLPFFLGKGPHSGAAIVTGRGEEVRGIASRSDLAFLLVKPPFGSATGPAYARVDEYRAARRHGGAAAWGASEEADCLQGPSLNLDELEPEYWRCPAQWRFFNSFWPALSADEPRYLAIRDALSKSGAAFVSLSGSGSCVFGVFATPEAAACAEEELRPCLAAIFPSKEGKARIYRLVPLASPRILD